MVMGSVTLALAGLLLFSPVAVNFDALDAGSVPRNWTVSIAPNGKPTGWRVKPDPTAPSRGNVLEQTAAGVPEPAFPVAIFDPVVCRDGDLSVKFRIDPAGSGRTAGVIWRYQDERNYYALDFTRKRIGLFRVQNGVRQAVRVKGKAGVYDVPHDIQPGRWHVARVTFRADRIRVYFGNRRLFEVQDSGLAGAGKTGVLTGGQTVASFDDFRIEKKS